MADGKETPADVLDDSQVSIWLDMSGTSYTLPNTGNNNLNFPIDGQTAYLIQQQMYSAYEKFAAAMMRACSSDPRVSQVPIRFLTPVFGRMDSGYGSYVAPGVIVT